MDTIKQTSDRLEFIHTLSPMARMLLALFGLIPFLAPYELLIKPSWHGGISFSMLFVLLISIGAVGISTFLFSAALFGRSQHFRFDASKRVVEYRFKTAINPLGEETHAFDQIELLQIKVNEWDSRPDTYDISMKIRGKRAMEFGGFGSRQEAEQYLAVLKKMTLVQGG